MASLHISRFSVRPESAVMVRWSSCYFGRGGSRNSPSPAPREFAASVHLVLFRGNCHFLLVCRNRAGSARASALLFGAQRSVRSRQNPGPFLGILPCHLRNIWGSRELVWCYTPPGRTLAQKSSRESRSSGRRANRGTHSGQPTAAEHPSRAARREGSAEAAPGSEQQHGLEVGASRTPSCHFRECAARDAVRLGGRQLARSGNRRTEIVCP